MENAASSFLQTGNPLPEPSLLYGRFRLYLNKWYRPYESRVAASHHKHLTKQ